MRPGKELASEISNHVGRGATVASPGTKIAEISVYYHTDGTRWHRLIPQFYFIETNIQICLLVIVNTAKIYEVLIGHSLVSKL